MILNYFSNSLLNYKWFFRFKGKWLIILSLISTLVIIGWMITDFFGGMAIYLIMYAWIIVPSVIIYLITFIMTFLKVIKRGIKAYKALFITHLTMLLSIIIFNLYQSELFKSPPILEAILQDDLSSINLVLRKNGHFDTIIYGMFGYTEKISGKYIINNDTITFLNKPYSNDFIPNKIIINKHDSAIYFKRDLNGQLKKKKEFNEYFQITKNELNGSATIN